ncbi:hypothetical protein FRC04_010224 [Tulasnella sp. 424]|nr:hypothetical protein FRC04_010224 [Tulasnella sp. 424]KAG8972074.1 hypothetical protein FRC05_010366 [Tulasnella sp. 425]
MNSQSILSGTPQESLDITRQRNAAESTTGAQPLGIYDRLTDAKTAIIDLIKNTAWTSNSSKAQQSLLQTVDSLANIPENTAQLSAGEAAAMEELMRTVEDVRERLKEASTKYGTKDARKRDMVKNIWAHLDRDGGIQVLEACRTNIEAAVNRLPKIYEPLPTYGNFHPKRSVKRSRQPSQG